MSSKQPAKPQIDKRFAKVNPCPTCHRTGKGAIWAEPNTVPYWIDAVTELLKTYFPATWEERLYKMKLSIIADYKKDEAAKTAAKAKGERK